MNDSIDALRRTLLKSAVAGASVSLIASAVSAGETGEAAKATPAPPPGKPGDFDFLTGDWKIRHRRLKTPGTQDWDEFDGEATCWGILGSVVSIEELRIPARNFSGMGLRVLDVEKKVWSDFWVNARSGVVAAPGVSGHFIDGAGIFESEELDGGKPLKVRGVWDRITPRSCRWYQETSSDGGKTWERNWEMDWSRV
jgi:hypothetical protein